MKKSSLRIAFASFAILGFVLAACGAAAATPFAETRGIVGAPVGEPSTSFAQSGGVSDLAVAEAPSVAQDQSSANSERLVIKTADLSIVVDNPEQTMQDISALAESMGGFVVSSNIYKNSLDSGVQVPEAYITVRVPSELFQQALDQIRAGAIDVPSDSQSGQDVTAEYTDLQSRLRNLQNAEEQLRQIMDNASRTEDVLNAFNQLNDITGQIEVLKGQIKYYEQSAAMSAISVDIIANESVQPIKVGPWDLTGTAKQAIEALVKALQGIAEGLVWFVLYVLPVLLIIILPIWLVVALVRRWLSRRQPKASPRKK